MSATRLAFRTAPLIAISTVALGVLSGLAAAPSAWLSKVLLDMLAARDGSTTTVVVLAGAASLLVAATTAFATLAGVFETELSGRVQYATQTKLVQACGSYPGTAFLDDPDMHERLNLARRGAHEAPPVLAGLLVTVVSSIAAVGSFALILAFTWPWMLALVLLTSIPMALLQRQASRRMFAAVERSAAEYRWAEYLETLFTAPAAAREMRLHNTRDKLSALHRTHLWSGVRLEVAQRRQAATSQALFTIASGCVAAVGAIIVGVSVMRGQATPGDFILFTTAVVAIQRVVVTLMSFAGHAAVAARSYSAYEEFINASTAALIEAERATRVAPPLCDSIEFCNVTFRYPNAKEPALRDFSAKFSVGSTYALCGRNGSGKTTVTRLLMKLYEPDLGSILWDGEDIRSFTAESVRNRMSGVMQDFTRYELSLEDNVLLGLEPGRDAERLVRNALGAVTLNTVIDQLPQGLTTMLSPTRRNDEDCAGSSLSGGQWQRIAIARAIARTPIDVLIMDEPDAALDADGTGVLGRLAFDSNLAKLTILVTHNQSTANRAEHVLNMERGLLRSKV